MNKIAKVVFAGESGVGKSSIVEKILYGTVSRNAPTIGACFGTKNVIYNDKSITLGLWDTAGQERYQSISTIYFRSAVVCVLVFDLSNRETLEKLSLWKNSSDHFNINSISRPIYFLVGNKSDIENKDVTKDNIDDFCENNDMTHYFETTTLTGSSVNNLLDTIAKEVCSIKFNSYTSIIKVDNTKHEPLHNCNC